MEKAKRFLATWGFLATPWPVRCSWPQRDWQCFSQCLKQSRSNLSAAQITVSYFYTGLQIATVHYCASNIGDIIGGSDPERKDMLRCNKKSSRSGNIIETKFRKLRITEEDGYTSVKASPSYTAACPIHL
ncbi:unnamed protein product [Onchocerca flexuosa]|uniref:Secreted protein n=1 Tax=Onchocerca flexuosa TaxID=387005 RepID=A0A183GYD4_9BILA|nr:unnamed protein product [Onchocerca flexuosa]